jgi:hypothetical protein
MNTKKMIINAILLAIGALLHQITPALGLPMQPDFALAMLIIIVLMNEDYKTALIAGIITGIFTALTTKFPGGQLPNIVDKLVTVNIIYFILLPLRDKVKANVKMAIVLLLGTLISGVTFLGSAAVMVGLPASFNALFVAVVLPATVINVIAGTILYNTINLALRRGSIKL